MGWICTTLRSEPPPPPSISFTVCFSDATRACLGACMFAPLDLYLCVSAVQTTREAIAVATAGLSHCGWLIISRPLPCFHEAEYVRASLCGTRLQQKPNRGVMQQKGRQGEIWEHPEFLKSYPFFLQHSNKEGNQRALLVSSCGFIFAAMSRVSQRDIFKWGIRVYGAR